MYVIAGSANINNLQQSILNPVSLNYFHDECEKNTFNNIKNIYSNNNIFVWALSNATRYINVFNLIDNGDFLLLKTNNQKDKKYFKYFSKIVYKVDSCKNIGYKIWKNEKWTKLLFLKNVENISIPDHIISQQLGLKKNFDYPFTVVREPINSGHFIKLINNSIYENKLGYNNFDLIVNDCINKEYIDEPKGTEKPISKKVETIIYQRDPYVKAWVLKNSKWICECCKKPSPFKSIDGHPFLEVHHLKMLSDGGSDTITNTVALCPNCHKEIHFGENRNTLKSMLYKNITRLIPE